MSAAKRHRRHEGPGMVGQAEGHHLTTEISEALGRKGYLCNDLKKEMELALEI